MTPFPFSPLDPAVRLHGDVNDSLIDTFWDRMQKARKDSAETLFMCMTTQGGDADAGRRMAQDIVLWRAEKKQDVYFLGKTHVYSAGVTIMSAFPRNRRFLTQDCVLLIHERRMTKDVEIKGPLSRALTLAEGLLSQIHNSLRLEQEGFDALAKGSNLTGAQIYERAQADWYLTAQEALSFGLVEGIV